jgi:hypothetical protein
MSDIVECRSEFTYAERPVALTWDGRRLEIGAILAAWRTPRGRIFRVRVTEGQTFEVEYAEAAGTWQIRQPQGG